MLIGTFASWQAHLQTSRESDHRVMNANRSTIPQLGEGEGGVPGEHGKVRMGFLRGRDAQAEVLRC